MLLDFFGLDLPDDAPQEDPLSDAYLVDFITDLKLHYYKEFVRTVPTGYNLTCSLHKETKYSLSDLVARSDDHYARTVCSLHMTSPAIQRGASFTIRFAPSSRNFRN